LVNSSSDIFSKSSSVISAFFGVLREEESLTVAPKSSSWSERFAELDSVEVLVEVTEMSISWTPKEFATTLEGFEIKDQTSEQDNS
jgi:hypothetical protein